MSGAGAGDDAERAPTAGAGRDGPPRRRASGASRRKEKRRRQQRRGPGDDASRRQGARGTDGARRGSGRGPVGRGTGDPRRLAVEVLTRIDADDAYANLALRHALDRSSLSERDRALATEIVYGATRMRRACDALVDPFVRDGRSLDAATRAALRVGAYQLRFTAVPAHAAVSTTVGAAPNRSRGLVNAVLRRAAEVAADGAPEDRSPGEELSYPDWIVERLTTDLGAERAVDALRAMNEGGSATVRADGYTQDRASQWVAELVGALQGERVLDMCAAPGGKATALAGGGATVVAVDLRPHRVGLVAGNARRTGTADRISCVVADGAAPPFPPGSFDRVLVDAPCTGLGVLHRRADARWRVTPDEVDRLAALQLRLVEAAAELLRPGGVLVVSACTLTRAETRDVDAHLARTRPDLVPLDPPGDPWIPWGRGALLLPQAAGTDGMALHRYRAPGTGP